MTVILPSTVKLVLAVFMALTCLPALANDSTASLETGELVLVPNDSVHMVEENLEISPTRVRVRYVFENTGPETVRSPVAFPLPPITFSGETMYAVTTERPDDPLGFRLWIDGEPVPVRIDVRATGESGLEVTDLLARWGLPVTLFTPNDVAADLLWRKIDGLSPQALRELRAAGAIGPDYGDGYVIPSWTAHIAYYWVMDFPPGVQVEVRHEYRPVPTHTFFSEYDLEARTWNDLACIDAGFETAARRMMAESEYGTLSVTILDYVLTTANNWRGPIGQFRLTVDKGSPAALVSLCRDGIRKTSPTTFEWEAGNYIPEADLTVLFLQPLSTD